MTEMTPPADLIERIEKLHRMSSQATLRCIIDDQTWPCDAAKLLAILREATGETDLRRLGVVLHDNMGAISRCAAGEIGSLDLASILLPALRAATPPVRAAEEGVEE